MPWRCLDADVEEALTWSGSVGVVEGYSWVCVGRAAAVVEDERRFRYLQDADRARVQDFPAAHGLVEVTGAVLVGDDEKEGDEEVPFTPGCWSCSSSSLSLVTVLAQLAAAVVPVRRHGGYRFWWPARSARRTRITRS